MSSLLLSPDKEREGPSLRVHVGVPVLLSGTDDERRAEGRPSSWALFLGSVPTETHTGRSWNVRVGGRELHAASQNYVTTWARVKEP